MTIARWVAGGVRTMLCFDPTRGIDIGTKRQIYALLRELAEAGAAVLLYTSELKEIQLACDRAIVIFNGRVVAEIPVEEADEPTLLRAAYDLPPDAADARGDRRDRAGGRGRRRAVDGRGDGMSAAATVVGGGSTAAPPVERLQRAARRNAWTLGLVGVLAVMLAFTKIIQPNYGPAQIQGLAIGVLPVAFAAIAQAIIVISGGIDLSVASIMSLTGVTAAVLLDGQGDGVAILLVLGVLALGLLVGAVNGSLIVVTRVPDIVVTLAMSFVWAGTTLLVLDSPGGGSVSWLQELVNGSFLSAWVPRAFLLLAVIVLVIWLPLRRSMLGLSMYALGSSRLAAFRSGVPVGRTKVAAYAIGGLFCAFGGLAINAATGSGSPVPGPYTLQSVAAVVLGGVSLAGGRGGIVGPIVACVILQLVRTDLTLLGVSPNLSTAIQGLILISVVLVGSVISMRRVRR